MFGLRAAVPTGFVLAPLIGVVTLLPGPAAAQTNPVSELKIGGLAHDVGFLDHHVEGGAAVNVELLFNSPDLLSLYRLAAPACRRRHQYQRQNERRLFRGRPPGSC